MRIRVRVDTSKPLCRGRKFRHEDGEIGWIRFKYERLPIMCYWCGRLSHSDKDCELWIRSNGSLTESDRQFGAWLCAPTYNTRKCSAVRVGGEEEVRSDGIYEVRDPSSKPDFQDTLREIDAAISKFDKPEMGSKPSGLGSSLDKAEAQGPSITMEDLGCPVSTDEEMNQIKGPPRAK